MNATKTPNDESKRLEQARDPQTPWKKWGPYLSERQWGTVREDYSENGDAWNYFTHDHARSRAYHWGEDGLAGISDDKQRLCFALALWNGKDPILKERLFGLTNSEGNHGEDVKEYYFYLDSTPTHSYMKYLYKYPQNAYPYDQLVSANKGRSRQEFEYELINTGVFNEDRYFDVFVEYAKESPEDILIQISVHNRGPEAAEIHLLPTLWFRNRWSWGRDNPRPSLQSVGNGSVIKATEAHLGERHLYCDGKATLLFTENESNRRKLFNGENRTPFVKDGIINAVVHGQTDAVNPEKTGTKTAAHYRLTVPPGKCEVVRLRLTTVAPGALSKAYGNGDGAFGKHFDTVLQSRRQEADEFYAGVIPRSLDADAANVMRQALAGMLWSKQYFYYDVNRWLEERGSDPYSPTAKTAPRNGQWHHMYNADVISMPDKWEYPWYAAWDLAFHVLPLTLVDADFVEMVPPFIFDAPFDQTALDSVRDMKERIDLKAHDRSPGSRNVKLGAGGIREIELVVQCLQVSHGAQFPQIRNRSTLRALEALHACNLVSDEECESLHDAYLFLRDVENKLQMVHDAQTHSLPAVPEELLACARLLGYTDAGAESASLRFGRDLSRHSQRVNETFLEVVGSPTLHRLRRA